MADASRLAAFRAHVPCSDDEWGLFLQSYAKLPANFAPTMLNELGWDFLPPPTPPRHVFDSLVKAIRVTVVLPAAKRPGPLQTGSESAAGKKRKLSAQQQLFFDTLEATPLKDMRESLQGKVTAPGTLKTHKPALPLYEAACLKAGLPAFPASLESLETFAAALSASQAYSNPCVYFFGILRANRDRGHDLHDPAGRISDITTALDRGTPVEEQCEPIGLQTLRTLAGAVVSDSDFDVLLTILGAFFSRSRIDSFLSLSVADVVPEVAGTKVAFSKLKGTVRKREEWVEFQRLEDHAPFKTRLGDVPCCPAAVFGLLRDRACARGDARLCKVHKYNKFLESMKSLFQQAGIENEVEGRSRHLYTAHSTRVGGVCTLLRAGLAEKVISTLAGWKSNMIERYSRRVVLEPSIVEPFAFFNPVTLKGSYSGVRADSSSGPASAPPS